MNVNNTLSVYLCFLMKKMLKYAPSLKKNRKESKQLREKDGECMSDIWRHRHLLEYFFVVGECSIRCVGRFTVEGSSLSWLISVFNDFVVAVTFLVHYHAAHSFVRLPRSLASCFSPNTRTKEKFFSVFSLYCVVPHLNYALFHYKLLSPPIRLYAVLCCVFFVFSQKQFQFHEKNTEFFVLHFYCCAVCIL